MQTAEGLPSQEWLSSMERTKQKTKTQVSWKRRLPAFHGSKGLKFFFFITEQEVGESQEEKKLPNQPRRGASHCRLAGVGSLLPTSLFDSYALSILSHASLPKENFLSRTPVAITALKNKKTKNKAKYSNHHPNCTPLTYDAFFIPIAASLKAHMGFLFAVVVLLLHSNYRCCLLCTVT